MALLLVDLEDLLDLRSKQGVELSQPFAYVLVYGRIKRE